MPNQEIYRKGQINFAQWFKEQLKSHRDWDIDIEWQAMVDKSNGEDTTTFKAIIKAVVVMALNNEDIETFGNDPRDIAYKKLLLEKKEQELVRKLQKPLTSLNQKNNR